MASTDQQQLCELGRINDKLDKVKTAIEENGTGGGSASPYTWETACAANNGRLIRIRIDNSTGVTTLWEVNTNTQITNTTAVKCEPESTTGPSYGTISTYTVVGSTATGYSNTTPAPFSINGNTVHAISYVVLQGTVGLKIGNNPVQSLTLGQSTSNEASNGLLTQTFIFSALTSDAVVSIITLS